MTVTQDRHAHVQDGDDAGSTLTVETDLDPDRLREAVRHAADAAAGRWYDPRLRRPAVGPSSITYQVARPLEHPTRVRLTWKTVDDVTRVQVSVRHAAGLSGGAQRLLQRFVSGLLAEIGGSTIQRPEWLTAS